MALADFYCLCSKFSIVKVVKVVQAAHAKARERHCLECYVAMVTYLCFKVGKKKSS